MEHNRTSTKSVPFFMALVLEPEFGQDLVRWGTCIRARQAEGSRAAWDGWNRVGRQSGQGRAGQGGVAG